MSFDVLSWIISFPLILMFYLFHQAYGVEGDVLAFFPFLLITLLLGLGHGLYRTHNTTLMAVKVSASIAGAHNATEVYQYIEDAVQVSFEDSVLIIYRKIPSRAAVRRVHTLYPIADTIPFREEVEAGDGITGWAIESRSSELVPDSLKVCGRYINPRLPKTMRSVMLVAMVSDQALTGLLLIAHLEPNKYFAEDLRMVQILATQAAVSLRKLDLLGETQRLSATDPLLEGIFNFRYFREAVEREMTDSLRTVSSFSVAFLDVDRFKHYNDTYGHPTGDTILQKIADTLSAALRERDVLARYGGDEFIVLLHGASRPCAAATVERLQRTVAALKVDGVEDTLGISAGLAVYPEDGSRLERLLSVADQSMYANKMMRKGRDSLTQA